MTRPTLAATILGRKLATLRLQSGLTQRDVCRQARFSDSKLSNIELGKVSISLFDVAGLCRIYNADPDLADQLERMSIDADSPGWWEPFETIMLKDFAMLLELESICSQIDIYESELIPGLLQTREYALAVNSSAMDNSEDVEQASQLRIYRQEQFWGRNPLPRVRIVVNASALRLNAVDADQRHRLLNATRLDGVDIRIIGDDTPHPSMRGSYRVLTSGVPEVNDCVYTESMTGARYDTDHGILSASSAVFNRTFAQAIPVEEYLHGR